MERLKRREGASKAYREMVYDVRRKSRARGVTEAMRGASFQRKRALSGIKCSQEVRTVKDPNPHSDPDPDPATNPQLLLRRTMKTN